MYAQAVKLKIMNKKVQIISLLCLGISQVAFSQIKEEKLILDRKREPEVRKIEKKKTSVETIKNYPPEEKSQNPVNYNLTNVPAASDFATSTIEGEDISPKLGSDYQDNYLQFGMGNFGKVLFDGNVSYILESKTEVGADAHVLSTSGLKGDYPWDSNSSRVDLGAFLNSYGEKGKFNATAGFGSHDYNYYGIYALQPDANTNLKQQVQNITLNGYYDHYSNEILNDIRLKTSFLSDKFDAKETYGGLDLNLSKHGMNFPLEGVKLHADLGLGLETLDTAFELLSQNNSNFIEGYAEPKLSFYRGKSYLMIGSGFSFLNSKTQNNLLAESTSRSKTYWFPRAEIFFAGSEMANLYLGVDGGLQHNSYASMLQENPYLVSDQVIRPTETKYRVYFGIRGDISQDLKYDVSAGFAKVNDILFYRSNGLFTPENTLNRPAYDFANTFSATYDNGSVNEVKASLQYFPLENLVLDGNVNYNFYRLNNFEDILNKPLIRAELGAKYTLLDKKLLLGFKGLFAGEQKTNYFAVEQDPLVPDNFEVTEFMDGKVKGFADLNLSVEYKAHRNVSVFVMGNNLLNNSYESHNAYRVLGAQFLAGLKVTF